MKKKNKPKGSYDLPADIIEGMPCIYIKGNKEVVIDGKCMLIDYSYERIVFDIYYRGKYLAIEGEMLGMRCSVKNITEIRGKIDRLTFIEKG